MNLKRIATTAAVPAVSALIAWVGGFDFNSRGFWQAWSLGIVIVLTVMVWTYPEWESSER